MDTNKEPTKYPMPVTERQYGRIGAGLPEYIHNDTFDENIEKHIFHGIHKNYAHVLEAQQRLCNIRRYTNYMTSFKIDSELNNRYGFISNHSSGANGTHFKTYSLKISVNLIDHNFVRDIKKLNIELRDDSPSLRGWKCRNPNVSNVPDENHSYMSYKDSQGIFHIDAQHMPDFKSTGGLSVCSSPTNLFGSGKRGVEYDIKKSKYLKTFSTADMCAHSNLFKYRVMFFINGFLHTNVRYAVDENSLYIFIMVDDGDTTGIQDLMREEDMLDYIKYQVPFTLLMMPWGPVMTYDGIGNNASFVDSNGLYYKAFTNLTPSMKLKKNFWMLSASWRSTSRRWPIGMTVTTFTDINSVKVGNTIKDVFNLGKSSPAMLESLMRNDMDVHAEAYCMPNVEGYSFIGTNRIFQIPLNGDPIPPSNILIWIHTPADTTDEDRKMDAGTWEFSHYGSVLLYYPNVYQVRNIADNAEIAVMWFANHDYDNSTQKFNNVLAEYMRYNKNFATATVNRTLPKYLLDFYPEIIDYDYMYHERYNKSTMADTPSYRIEKLTELMKDDPTRYEYVYEKLMESTATRLHANPKQTLNLSKLSQAEYDTAFRTDMSDADIVPEDIKQSANFSSIKFNEEHFMLIIEHPFMTAYKYTVWVDGIQCNSAQNYTKFLRTFIYIPKSKLSRNSIIEVEMMRVSEHGRITAEVDFSDVDTSIKLPRKFYDVSPQNMLVSIRTNTSTWKDDTEMTEEYKKKLEEDHNITVVDDFGTTFFYKTAPEYEMLWLLFGYNRYVDGKRQFLDEDKNMIKHKQLHEIVNEHPVFPEPASDRNHIYGILSYERSNGTIITKFKRSDSGAIISAPFNTDDVYIAVNYGNKKFVGSKDGKMLVEFNTSLATFQEINYFKKAYRHYHTNADASFVSAQRIIGIPVSNNGFISVPNEDGTIDWIIDPGDMDDSAIYVTIGDNGEYIEYRFNKLTNQLEKMYSSADEVDNEYLSALTSTLLEASPDGKRWMELYAAFDETIADPPPEKATTNPINMESGLAPVNTNDNSIIVTPIDYPWCDGFYALDRRRFYQYLPYGKDAPNDIYITPIGIPSTMGSVDIVSKFIRDGDNSQTNGKLTYYPIDSNKTNATAKRTWYYMNSDYPNSYFANKHALIQNTDIYNKESFEIDYSKTNKVTIAHFYDEPTYQRFRVTVNGYRMDHGTDYTTDIGAITSFIRGNKIVFTFNKNSANYINALQSTLRFAPRVKCTLIGEPNEDGSINPQDFVLADGGNEVEIINFATTSIYVDSNTMIEYVYNPKRKLLLPYDPMHIVDTGFTNANVLIEYMPYKSRIVYKSTVLKSDCVGITNQQLTRPISLKYYDIFVGGVKVNSANIKIVTPRRVIINKELIYNGACLTIYERCHDADLYGNEIKMPDTINDIIAQHDPEFRKFLYSIQ